MKKNKLYTITTDDNQIIPIYGNKQVTLGVLVRKKDSNGTNFEIIKNVVVYMTSAFGLAKDVVTNESYNCFDLEKIHSDAYKIRSNKFHTDLTSGLLGMDQNVGVVSYGSLYSKDKSEMIDKYILDNNLKYSSSNINYISSLSELKIIREILNESVNDKDIQRKREAN